MHYTTRLTHKKVNYCI